MQHQIMFANSSRMFVRVDDTWYDTHKEFDPQVGQRFLIGRIDEVLNYDEYTKKFGKRIKTMHEDVTEKTQSGGYLRKTETQYQDDGTSLSRVVYAVNPIRSNTDSYNALDFE